jgi:hypothetical protein
VAVTVAVPRPAAPGEAVATAVPSPLSRSETIDSSLLAKVVVAAAGLSSASRASTVSSTCWSSRSWNATLGPSVCVGWCFGVGVPTDSRMARIALVFGAPLD